ncbi:unnamed protein product, partial [Cyprideis torosa]
GYVDEQGKILSNPDADFRHLALASPELAPYGAAARQVLENLQLTEQLQERVVTGENISQAYQFVQSANAELGFVAASQVMQDGQLMSGSVWRIPMQLYQPIKQDAVLLNRGKDNPAAGALLDFLRSEAVEKVLIAYGYQADLSALWLTLKVSLTTTLVLLLIGTPMAWWLHISRWRWKPVLHALIALPLVLPPTVIGFYLLVMMGPSGPVGQFTQALGLGVLPFTFWGLVVASCFYSLPFVVQPLHNAFAAIGQRPLEVAATLRASPLDTFFSVVIPLAKPGFLTASILGFAHTV